MDCRGGLILQGEMEMQATSEVWTRVNIQISAGRELVITASVTLSINTRAEPRGSPTSDLFLPEEREL